VKRPWVAQNTSSLWEPAIVLPSQLEHANGYQRSPELRLVAAVLEDALQCVNRNVGVRNGRRWREFRDACRWFSEDNRNWPFSFRNICDLLGLDAHAVRERVRTATGMYGSEQRPHDRSAGEQLA